MVGNLEIRKDFVMNVNTLAIVYLTFSVLAAIIIFLENMPTKKD